MWNFVSAVFCSSVNEFSVPDLRSEKALSVGANMVKPRLAFSWLLIRSSTWVLFSSPMKVVNLPAFLRIAVMSGGPDEEPEETEGPEGAAAGAED